MSSPPRFSHLSDWELWACAKQQIVQHGDIAAERAALRADELLAAGEMAGTKAWVDIVARIRHLQWAQPDETRH